MLICPICSAALLPHDGCYVCANRHSFDRAREGYVNLLRSKRTGDSKEMLLARRAFLDRGHYAPLAGLLATHVATYLHEASAHRDTPREPAARAARAILDVGCGEGYYLDQIGRSLAGVVPLVDEVAMPGQDRYTLVGIDSSREAIRLACRRVHPASFAVADVLDGIPLATGAAWVLLNIFAPRNIPEFARVLAPGGLLLIVIPAPDHLAELRAALDLLGIEEQKEERLLQGLAGLFGAVETRTLGYTLDLQPDDLLHLIEMTPNGRHQDRGWRERLMRLAGVPVRAAFTVLACRRV